MEEKLAECERTSGEQNLTLMEALKTINDKSEEIEQAQMNFAAGMMQDATAPKTRWNSKDKKR